MVIQPWLLPSRVHNKLLFKYAEAFYRRHCHRLPILNESGTSRRESIAIAHMFRAIPPSLHIAAAPTGSASTSYPTKVAENAHLFLWTLQFSTKIATSCTSLMHAQKPSAHHHQLPHLVASMRQHYNNMRKRTREYARTIEYGAHRMLMAIHYTSGEKIWWGIMQHLCRIATKYATTSEYYCFGILSEYYCFGILLGEIAVSWSIFVTWKCVLHRWSRGLGWGELQYDTASHYPI